MASDRLRGRGRGERDGPMDVPVLREAAYLALALLVIWEAAVMLIRGLREPVPGWVWAGRFVPAWSAIGLTAVYYTVAMARGMRPPVLAWMLFAAGVFLPAGVVWRTSGWEAGLVVALALGAWIPFAVTWSLPVARFLGVRGRLAKLGVVLLCAVVPLAWTGVASGMLLIHLLRRSESGFWRLGLAVAVVSLAVVAPAVHLSRRARRAARGRDWESPVHLPHQ